MEKTEVKPRKESKKDELNLDLEEMLKAGLHFGHRVTNGHPKMAPYLQGVRNGVQIIDLEKTAEKLKEALKFIQKLISDGKILLFVGTKIQIKNLVKEIATDCDLPYVNERWLGGTFTNFEVLKKRIEYFKDLERKKETGELEKYTKRERLKIDEELERLRKKFEGIKKMERLPDTVFVLDMRKDELAIKEAKMKGVTVIGICDSNVDPSLADYIIPANDDAIPSVKYILEKAKGAILRSRKEVKGKEEEKKED